LLLLLLGQHDEAEGAVVGASKRRLPVQAAINVTDVEDAGYIVVARTGEAVVVGEDLADALATGCWLDKSRGEGGG
jgi:hypothetical protein